MYENVTQNAKPTLRTLSEGLIKAVIFQYWGCGRWGRRLQMRELTQPFTGILDLNQPSNLSHCTVVGLCSFNRDLFILLWEKY